MALLLRGCGGSSNSSSSSSTSSEDDSKQTFRLLLESERGSDITLLVGAEGGQERIPAHSWVLGHNNDYFRTLLEGPLRDAARSTFIFPDDPPNAFNNLIRWLYGCNCTPQGTQSALDTLQVAVKYLCPDLVHHIVSHLSKHLRPTTVLQVLAWGDHFASLNCGPSLDEIQPSAPPLSDMLLDDGDQSPHHPPDQFQSSFNRGFMSRLSSKSNLGGKVSQPILCPKLHRRKSESNPVTNSSSPTSPSIPNISSNPVLSKSFPECGSSLSAIEDSTQACCSTTDRPSDPTTCCRLLVAHCLAHIDSHATEVLSSEKLESLPSAVLSSVLSRDSLATSNEALVLDALYRWSNAECRRQHQMLTLTGRRKVLGSMLTLPRLLTLTPRNLSKMAELYESTEIEFVSAKIRQEESVSAVPPLFQDHLERMAQPRSAKAQKGQNSAVLCRKFSKKDIMMNMFSVIALVID